MSLFYAAFFVSGGISLPFLPAWLGAKGLDPGEIGVVLAAPMIVRLIVVPPAMRVADRYTLLRPALIVTTAVTVFSIALVGLMHGFPAILAAYALASVTATLVLPLGDTYVLRGLAERRKPYGPVRLWGSVAFIAANFAGGLALTLFGAVNLIWAVVAASVLVAASTIGFARLTPEPAVRRDARLAGTSLWRIPTFVVVVAAASLIQSSHAVLQGFATLQWTARGLSGPVIGALWALGVVAEIALFAVAGRVMAVVGAVEMIFLGGIGAVVRWGVMAFDPPSAVLPLLQCLHALSFGATHLGTMQALTELAPHRSATAQGDFAAVQGITYAAAMALSGLLFEAYGSLAYGAMVLVAAAGALAAILGRRRWREADPA